MKAFTFGLVFMTLIGIGTFVSDTFDLVFRADYSLLQYGLKYIGVAFLAGFATVIYSRRDK
jgi:hypothetical protein